MSDDTHTFTLQMIPDDHDYAVRFRCTNDTCPTDRECVWWFRDVVAAEADKLPHCSECGEPMIPPGWHAARIEGVEWAAEDDGQSDDSLTCVFCGTSYAAEDDGGGECPECGDEAMGGRVQRYDPMADEWS